MSYSQNEVKSKLVSPNYSLNDRKLLNEIVQTNNNDNDNHQQANQTPLELSSSNGDNIINQEPWDNVYKLLQQLNDLREANSKLQKKVQFLEGMKLLTKLHQDIRDDPEFSEFFSEFFRQKYHSLEDRGDTEAASDDGVFINLENTNKVSASKTTDENEIKPSANRTTRELRMSTLARERSKSVGHEEILNQGERAKVIKSKRFPRWSRVKTALGWDKTSQANAPVSLVEKSDGKSKKSQNESTSGCGDAASNASGSEFVNCEATSGCDIDKGFKLTGRGGSERRILGIKSIISSRKNSLNRSSIKSESRSRKNDPENVKKDNHDHKVSGEVDENDYYDYDNSVSQNSQSGISITLGSGIKGSKSLGDISSNSHSCSKYLVENLNRSGKSPTSSSSAIQKSTKTKTGKTGTALNADSIIPSSHNDMPISSIDTTAICKYAKSRYRSIEGNSNTRWTGSQRMPSMSPPVKRRSKWIKMRKVFANASEGVPRSANASLELNSTNIQSVPASPMSSDTSFNYVMAWNENETGSGEDGDGETANGYEEVFDAEGRSKEMDRSDDGECEKDDDYMLPLSESATEPVLNLVQELQRNLSEDFRKKIEEWEKIKSGDIIGVGSGADGFGLGGSSTRMPVAAKVERKTSLPKLKKRKSDRKLEKYRAKYKDLNWVEKELTRANKEKEKLDRERTKFEERIKVLQKCKEDALATEKGTKKEVFVRTSEGEFRFEGITDDFTKKLYEWETKKGLCPEASIMTLLDSSPGPSSCTTLGSPPSLEASLFDQEKSQMRSSSTGRHQTRHPLNRCISRSESSLLDPLSSENGLSSAINKDQNSKITSTSLPSLQQVDPCSEYESVLLPAGVTEDIDSRRAHLIRQQQQVARQLFNLESSSEFQPATIPVWGDGEKCMVTVNPDGSTIIVGSKQDIYEMTKEILGEAGDEGYISLLEANMFLLEKLNAKEDVCRNLEMQLKQLDSKMDEMNEKHRKEMEKYREKLWEIHGNKSSNTKESNKVICELKDRVEKLQLCSERLKADKEALEDSFQYHSEQQAKLAIELIGKMRNLQEISVQAECDTADDKHETGKRTKSVLKCCPENVIKLHDLSTSLLEKARELELALVERTKQICRLRWELLNREVSAMKMKTELHSTQLQDGNRTINVPTANIKRTQYGQRRSWSSSERLNYKQTGIKGYHSGLDVDSWIISEDWPKIQKETSELSETVQQLKMELLKLASQAQSRTGSSSECLDDGERIKIEGMKGIKELFTSSLPTDLMPNDYSDTKNNYSDETKFTSRHHQNSGDNISSFSGPEGSESSSLNDAERTSYVLRLPRNRWRRSHDNVSSSSESSFKDEESFTVAEWCRPRTNSHFSRRTKVSSGNNKKGIEEQVGSLESQKSEELTREMVLSYGNHSISRSSSELTDQRNDSWGELYKHRLFFNHFSETSSSTHNEGFEESSSASMNNPFQSYNYDTPDSTQSNLRSSSSSGHDRYIGIPMIDEDYPGGSIGGGLSGGPKGSEFQVIPEGQVMSMAGEERRHSEPCRKFKYSIRAVNRNLVSNSAISIAEGKEDQSPSPIVYTIRLSPSRMGSKCTADQDDKNYEDMDELLETPTTEYVLCEPKENIFFTRINRDHSPSSPPKTSSNQETLDSFSQKSESRLGNVENISTNSLTSTCKSDFLEPLSNVSQDNRSPSSTSLTSLGSERSIVKSRTSQDSQVSLKEKDTSEITRSSSKSSLTSKVASFINRRSRSKSRTRSESNKQSAIGALCRQSLTLTVDPKNMNETKILNYSNVIVTEALKAAASTATATISMAPSISSLSSLPLSSNEYAASTYQQFQSDHK